MKAWMLTVIVAALSSHLSAPRHSVKGVLT